MVIPIQVKAKCINEACPIDIYSVSNVVNISNKKGELSGFVILEDQDLSPKRCKRCKGELRAVGQVFQMKGGEVVAWNYVAELKKQWQIRFTNCTINSQEIGSDNEHMVSKISFIILAGDDYKKEHMKSLTCIVRQPYGESFSILTSPIEVETPEELKGKVNFSEFQAAVEGYYRKFVGENSQLLGNIGDANVFIENMQISWQANAIIQKVGPSGNAW